MRRSDCATLRAPPRRGAEVVAAGGAQSGAPSPAPSPAAKQPGGGEDGQQGGGAGSDQLLHAEPVSAGAGAKRQAATGCRSVGTVAGAGAGTAAVLGGGRNPATLPNGAPITVRLLRPTTVTVEQ